MKKQLSLFIAFISLLSITTGYAQKSKNKADKNKSLDNKKYNVQFYETKATGRGKAVPSTVEIRGGKIESDLMNDKLKLNAISYDIVSDSSFTEDDEPGRIIVLEATHTENKDDFKWEVTINNYEIEGTVIQTKNGVEKKKFEFSGSEKTKK